MRSLRTTPHRSFAGGAQCRIESVAGGELVGHAPAKVAGSRAAQVGAPAFGGTRIEVKEKAGFFVGIARQNIERELIVFAA